MTAPLKIPAPARLPRDMTRPGPELAVPRSRHEADDSEDDTTMLWKASDRSGLLSGGGFATASAQPFAFQAEGSEDDSTLIARPDLRDPRLRRSDRPPAPLAGAQLALAPPAPPEAAPALDVSPSLSMPSDWEETPPPVLSIRPATSARPRVAWALVVGLTAIAAISVIVSNPEQSAVFVERVVAGGSALVASLR